MSRKPRTRAMREDPDLDQLKRQAKELLDAYRARQLEAVAELSRHGRVTALSLRPGRSLAELEAALTPILPRFHGGQLPRE